MTRVFFSNYGDLDLDIYVDWIIGTGDYSVHPCPNGTFSNNTGLTAENDCFDCTAGWACVGLALTEPNVLCEAGYFCQGKAKTPAPLDTITGDRCPEGHYCPEGSGMPNYPSNFVKPTHVSLASSQTKP